MKHAKKYILVIIFIMLCGFGAALAQKAAVGVGAYDAMSMSFSLLTGMPVGNIGMIANCICIFLQLVFLRTHFKIKHLLQIPLSILLGMVINFVLYNVLENIVIEAYWLNIVLLVISLFITAFAVGAIMELNFITFPLEGVCKVIADKFNIKFSLFRQLMDVVFVVVCLALTFILDVPLTAREGTVIGAIIFGPAMGFFMTKMNPFFVSHDLIEKD